MWLVAMAKMSVVAFTKSVSRCDLIRLQLSWKWTPTRELSQINITITVKTYITRGQSHLCGWTSDWLPWQLLLWMNGWLFTLRMKRSKNFLPLIFMIIEICETEKVFSIKWASYNKDSKSLVTIHQFYQFVLKQVKFLAKLPSWCCQANWKFCFHSS